MLFSKIIRFVAIATTAINVPALAATSPQALLNSFKAIETAADSVRDCATTFDGTFVKGMSCALAFYKGHSAGKTAIAALQGIEGPLVVSPDMLAQLVNAYQAGGTSILQTVSAAMSLASNYKSLGFGPVVALLLAGYDAQRVAFDEAAVAKLPASIQPILKSVNDQIDDSFKAAALIFRN